MATIGGPAPFVGLFGTVCFRYHSLVAIGMSGFVPLLDKWLAPVGEGVLITDRGIGLWPSPCRRSWSTTCCPLQPRLTAKLRLFAFELLTFLSMGLIPFMLRRLCGPPGSLARSAGSP